MDIADEWSEAGWDDVDLFDAENVIDVALDYMDEHGYF